MPELLDKADERKLAFIPAVELSYHMNSKAGYLIFFLVKRNVDKIIVQKNHEPPKAIKVPNKAIRDFFPPDTTPKEFEQTIQDALTEYFKTHPSKHNKNATAIER